MIRKLTMAMLVICLLVGCVLSIHAQELPDLNRKGGITFLMEYDGELLTDGVLTLTRVGRIVEEDGLYHYELVSELGEGIVIDNLTDPKLAEELSRQVQEKNLTGDTAAIQAGRAKFSDLELGLYLVTQAESDASTGFNPISPFLITIPQYTDKYVYDIEAKPKAELVKPTTEPSTEPSTTPTTTTPEPTEPPKIPQTGQLNWPIPLLLVCGMALLTLGCYLHSGRKNHHES